MGGSGGLEGTLGVENVVWMVITVGKVRERMVVV